MRTLELKNTALNTAFRRCACLITSSPLLTSRSERSQPINHRLRFRIAETFEPITRQSCQSQLECSEFSAPVRFCQHASAAAKTNHQDSKKRQKKKMDDDLRVVMTGVSRRSLQISRQFRLPSPRRGQPVPAYR